jgi:hypothetical protein
MYKAIQSLHNNHAFIDSRLMYACLYDEQVMALEGLSISWPRSGRT